MFPVARMALIVRDGSRLQHNDYWQMLPRFTDVNGGLDLGGLFTFQNQPVVIPQIIYWLNMKLFAGSNISLGFVVVLLVLVQLAVVALLLRQSRLGAVESALILVVASALLFNLTGTWNFSKSMSGTAWFSANLFALIAVLLRSRDRSWWAFLLAVLASMSYGTGLAAWVAVIATGVTRRPSRSAWREWPHVVGFVTTLLWYQAAGGDSGMTDRTYLDIVRQTAVLLGFVLGLDGALGSAVGLLALVVVPVLIAALVSTTSAAGWVGVATFGLIATLEVSFGRTVVLQLFGTQDRYSSPPAVLWLGLFALVLVALRRFGCRSSTADGTERRAASFGRLLPLAVAAPLLVGAVTAGSTQADEMLALNHPQELREIALRLDATDGTAYLIGFFTATSTVTEVMRANAHHPFVEGWDLDCGLLDTQLDAAEGRPVRRGQGALTSGRPITALPGAVELSGHLTMELDARCVVIANEDGVVVGAATIGAGAGAHPVPASSTRFQALARRGEGAYRAFVVLEGSSDPLLLEGELTAHEVEAA